MSNNKQSMKLYTEKELRKHLYNHSDEFFEQLTPIDLPTDKDTAHLQWIYDRMSNVHGENENYDYMLKFKEIIEQLKK
jgi:hypothetical protein